MQKTDILNRSKLLVFLLVFVISLSFSSASKAQEQEKKLDIYEGLFAPKFRTSEQFISISGGVMRLNFLLKKDYSQSVFNDDTTNPSIEGEIRLKTNKLWDRNALGLRINRLKGHFGKTFHAPSGSRSNSIDVNVMQTQVFIKSGMTFIRKRKISPFIDFGFLVGYVTKGRYSDSRSSNSSELNKKRTFREAFDWGASMDVGLNFQLSQRYQFHIMYQPVLMLSAGKYQFSRFVIHRNFMFGVSQRIYR